MKYCKYWFKNVWLAICGGYTTPPLTKKERELTDKYMVNAKNPKYSHYFKKG
jgi:hypothetical protein